MIYVQEVVYFNLQTTFDPHRFINIYDLNRFCNTSYCTHSKNYSLSSWCLAIQLLICLDTFLPVQCNSNMEWCQLLRMKIWISKILMIRHTPTILLLFASVHWVPTQSQHHEPEMRCQKLFFLGEVLLSAERERERIPFLDSNTKRMLYEDANKEDTESFSSSSSRCLENWKIKGNAKIFESKGPSLKD